MKSSKKVICGVIVLLGVMVICLAGLGLRSKEDKAGEDVWEREFYHCADVLKERIENMNATEYILPEYDEMVRQEQRTVYLNGWQTYMNFVEAWIELSGDTQEKKAEIFKKATILMVLIDDNHDANYGFKDKNREYCEFVYYDGMSRKKLLSAGNRALQRETIIDTSIAQLNKEVERDDNYGEIYRVEAKAWENEFLNCVKIIEGLLATQTENKDEVIENKKVLEIWKTFIEQWTECNVEYATIDAGSGMDIDMAERKRECYRTATLLMIAYYEQFSGEYEFIFDAETARETLMNAIYF